MNYELRVDLLDQATIDKFPKIYFNTPCVPISWAWRFGVSIDRQLLV